VNKLKNLSVDYMKIPKTHRWPPGIQAWAIAPLKPEKLTLFTTMFYNSEKSIRDIGPFCCPSFGHSSVM